jgi:hypothetical protein
MDEEEKKARPEKPGKRNRATLLAHRIVMNDFDEIDDFNDFMKSAIKRELDLPSKRLEEGASGLEGEDLEQYWDYYAQDYQKIGSVFEKLALDSFIIVLYSRVETGMATLCDALRQDKQKEEGKKNIGLRYSVLGGSGFLDQARLYLKKVLGVDIDLGNTPQWPEIIAMRALRNAIVNENGWLNTKNAILKKHIKQGLLELINQKEENGQISGLVIVRPAYIDYILPQVRSFFQNIKI